MKRRLSSACLVLVPALVGCSAARSDVETPGIPVRTSRGYDLQGHRGARGLRPENTLVAFEAALDHGVDTLELDLHWSADNQLIVWHDPVVDPAKCRAPAPPPSSGRVRQLTAAELGQFVCDLNPDVARFPEQSSAPGDLSGSRYEIATLAGVLDFVDAYAASPAKTAARRDSARRVRFNIETKRADGAIDDGFDGVHAGPFERTLVELLQRRGLLGRTTVQSFDHRSLWAIHALNPNIALAALTETSHADLQDLHRQGATTWSPHHEGLTAQTIAEAHRVGLRVVPWTVNDPTTMRQLLELGVDGLITDRPDLAPLSKPQG